MASTDLLLSIFPHFSNILCKRESQLLETILFIYLYQELSLIFRDDQTNLQENNMLNSNVINKLVNDLLINDDYSLEGLAKYTGYPIEVIYDLAAGMNTDPAFNLSTKIIELHALARREFYDEILKKVISKCLGSSKTQN